MNRYALIMIRVVVISAGVALLATGCEREDTAKTPRAEQTAGDQRVMEVPASNGQAVQSEQTTAKPDDAQPAATAVSESDEPESDVDPDADAQTREAPETKVVAYYFHRTMRCRTCLSIEQQAQDAIEMAYAEELQDGRFEWRPVNIEEAGNAHFESDSDLGGSSLVIVQMAGGDVVAWKNLERVWELEEEPIGFREYVWAEMEEYYLD